MKLTWSEKTPWKKLFKYGYFLGMSGQHSVTYLLQQGKKQKQKSRAKPRR